jgi:hypothetical protein
MQRMIFVTFPQFEAPPGFAEAVGGHLDELAAYCPGLVSCALFVDREPLAGGGYRYLVRFRLGRRRCCPDDERREISVTADTDLGRGLRRAFDHARRVAGHCRPVPAVTVTPRVLAPGSSLVQ